MTSTQIVADRDKLTNEGLVVLATYVAGGASGYADTEDIAIAANRLAPGRFNWRKYRDQINIDTVRKRLWDAARESSGGLLVGSEKQGWLLTEAGLAFCEAHKNRLNKQTSRQDRFSRQEHSWIVRERARMSSEAAFTKWSDGRAQEITPVEAERFFRIDDYVIGKSRAARLERAIQAFNADEVYGPAVREIARLVRER
jgi:hypothetical protein